MDTSPEHDRPSPALQASRALRKRWKTFTPGAIVIGLIFIVAGGAVAWWKVAVLNMPMAPSDPVGLWSVEAVVTARGDGKRGSVRLSLPNNGDGQRVYDEHFSADHLPLSIRRDGKLRTAVWTGTFDGTHRIVYGFRVQLADVDTPVTEVDLPPVPETIAENHLGATADFPVDAPEVNDVLQRIHVEGRDAVALRSVYAFVSQEVGQVGAAADDALLTLGQREGTELGKAKLLVTLLRATQIPARVVQGIQLREGKQPDTRAWVEAWVGNWVTLSAGPDFFAARPGDLLALRNGTQPLMTSNAVEAASYQYRTLKERLRPEETAAVMLPSNPMLASLSLYRLPLQAQAALALLLLFPFGVLILALFRNVIGIQTYGTFMPVLIAFALRGTGLGTGLFLVALVLAIGALGRMLLERLRLMIVPRLAIMLCVVVLCVTGLALTGTGMGQHDLYAGLLFPIVILTMLVERFSVTIVEEGPQSAAKGAFFTTLVAVSIYPVMTSVTLSHAFFAFPELIFCVIGVLIIIGGYTGYRLLDLWRFRALVTDAPGARP